MAGVLRWIALGILFFVFVFLCGVLASVPMTNFVQATVLNTFRSRDGTDAQRAIQALAGMNFPNTASDFHYANWGDDAYWMQFRAPPQALNGLFSGSGFLTCNFPLVENYRPTFDFERILSAQQRTTANWWNPESVTRYTGGECTGRDYKIFRMFADTSNNNAWLFYMEVVQS